MKKLLLPFFFIGCMAMIVVMTKTGAMLNTPEAPHGVLNLEFAYNTAKTAPIINSWASINHTDLISAAKINTYWDFLFLFFYAGFLFLACKKIASNANGPVAKAGILIAKGALLAGFLDVLENAGMLLTLNNKGSSTVAFFTTFFSVIKWGLAIIAVLYVLTGILVWVYRKIRY
jgi:hypothetical protein